LWAHDDDELQIQRANRALASYRLAVAAAVPNQTGPIVACTRINGSHFRFLDQDEAMKEFDAAIKIGPVAGALQRCRWQKRRVSATLGYNSV
jgi:hypothetical protein